MTNKVREILQRRCKSSNKPFNINIFKVERLWDRMRKTLGYENEKGFVLHAFRHTCATTLIQKDVPITTVQAYLGHANISTTQIYAHLNPKKLKDAAQTLEEG